MKPFIVFTCLVLLFSGCASQAENSEQTGSDLSVGSSAESSNCEFESVDNSTESSGCEFESEQDEVWRTLEESFYWDPSTALEKSNVEIKIKDEYGVIDTDAIITLTKLIPTFSIPTDSKSETLKICDEINEGTPLLQLLEDNNEYYTITKDSSGNDNGFALLSLSSDGNFLNIEAFGEIDDQCRQDLQLTASIREKLQKTNLDIPNTVARHCTINNFSVGVLFSDGKNEYYMPTVETFQSLTFLQLGELYSPTELTDIINDNIATIFPTNEIDESGNPYLGGEEYPEAQ